MNEMGDWANFFVAEVGASAALTGLVVVAISINLSRILAYAYLPGRAAEALILLAGVMLLTSLALVPHQPTELLGTETLAIGLVMFAAPAVIQLRSRGSDAMSPSRKLIRTCLTAAPSLLIVLAGVVLACGSSAGLYWIAAGVVLSLVTGILTTWVLLIEILR
jgi:hypothetical protein